jgi:hypothetical protein
MQRSLLDQLIELTKSDYPDDYVRFGHLACAIEGEAVSLDEAVRRRLRVHGRYDLAGFSSRLAHEVSASRVLCKKFVEHFADVFRNQMVGRTKGSRETNPLEPALIRSEALRFDPDELVLDKGELTIVDVRIEPAPAPLPSQSAAPVGKPGKKVRLPGGRPREIDRDAITGVAKDCAKKGVEEFLDRFVERVCHECRERRPLIRTPKSRSHMREICRAIWDAARGKSTQN